MQKYVWLIYLSRPRDTYKHQLKKIIIRFNDDLFPSWDLAIIKQHFYKIIWKKLFA